jgi:ABC-type transporter Mla subunit MlaD
MKAHWMDFIVGLLFFLAMGVLGYTTIFKAQRFGKVKYYQVSFPRVYGLKEGSPVRCEGKDVGEVKSLRLVEDAVLAVLEVSDAVTIYADGSKINVTPFSPLGGRIVEISRGKKGSGVLEASTLVEGTPQGKQLKGEAEGELLSALTGLIKENREKINEIVENVRSATERLGEKTNLAGKILNDENFADQFDGIATNLNKASKSVEVVSARLERGEGVIGQLTVQDTPLQKNLEDAVENASNALDEFNKVGKSMNEGEGLINVVLNDKDFADDWRGTSSNITKVTGTLAENKGIMRLVSEAEVYENIRDFSADARDIAAKVNDEKAGPLGVLVSSKSAGDNLESTIDDLSETARKLNDANAGPLGALIADEELGKTTRKVFNEVARVIVEFRDSLEDVREQAPVNAFIGTVFSAF